MHIPFFSLARQWEQLKSKLEPALARVLETQQYIGGPIIENFEHKFAEFTQSSYAVACNSGTDALWIALQALDLKPNSLVITTPFSFIASSSEITAHGAIPVFIDIEKTSYNISPEKIKTWLEKNAIVRNKTAFQASTGLPIVGMVVVNIFGQCADYAQLQQIAHDWHLWIVEDAAQSIGATYQGKQSGNFGTVTCFSFYPTKNLGGIGDGGMMTTHDQDIAIKLKQQRNHGRLNHYEYQGLGRNSRLDTLQAVVLQEKLAHLESFNKRRAQIAAIYDAQLGHLPFLQLPKKVYGTHTYHQYCINVVDSNGINYREQLMKHLAQHKVETRIFYPQGLNTFDFLLTDKRFTSSCPVSDALTQGIMALPLWPELTDEEIKYVCDTVKSMPYYLGALNPSIHLTSFGTQDERVK